jgi:hypothetical protein
VFDSKTRLYPGEREAISASGIRFKNGKWPSAQAYVPGYFPWKVGTGGMENLCVALEQLLAKVLSEDRDIPDFLDRDDPLCTRTCRCGVWSEAVRQHVPKISEEPFALPGDLLEAVRKLPVRVQCVEADCFPLLMPTGKEGTRMVCPRQMVLIDRASGLALAFELLMPEEGKEWSFVTAIPVFLTMLDRLGYRPATLTFAGEIMEAWATPLCAMLGIRVEQSLCEALLEYRAEMEDFFMRR